MERMKKRNLLLPMLIIFAISFFTCNQKEEPEEEILGGEVPFELCPQRNNEEEHYLTPTQPFPRGEAYLFKDSIPVQMMNQINIEIHSDPYPTVCWIIYYSEKDSARIIVGNKDGFYVSHGFEAGGGFSYKNWEGLICNFPDFAKDWDIPVNGIKVDVEGEHYRASVRTLHSRVIYNYYYVLTSFKTIRK